MPERYEIRLSGEGGQGVILAAIIMAEAAAIYDGKNAIQTQSYGPEARGGASKSEVVISDGPIDYPKATRVDLLLSFTQESCDKYIKDLKEGGILIVDSDYVTRIPDGRYQIYRLPIIDTAAKEIGKVFVANIVALGVIVEITGIVSKESIEKAVLARVPKGTEDLNRKALYKGFELVKKYRERLGSVA